MPSDPLDGWSGAIPELGDYRSSFWLERLHVGVQERVGTPCRLALRLAPSKEPSFGRFHQRRSGHTQATSDPEQQPKARLSLASFELPVIRTIDAGQQRKLVLGQALVLTHGAYDFSESLGGERLERS